MRFTTMTPMNIVAASSLALPIAAIFVWSGSWWPPVLFVLWGLAIGAYWAMSASRRHDERFDRMLDHAHASAIQTLSHHRHDWMNELQVLYGYLRLNKPDKAVDVVDRIRVRMEHDSRLSHIGNPKLSIYFLSFRTMCDSMRLEVVTEEGLQLGRTPDEADRIARAVIGMINVIRVRATHASGDDKVLTVGLSKSESGYRIDLNVTGELAAEGSITAELTQCLDGIGQLADRPAETQANARTMSVHIPLPA
ncbi:MAG: Spo0B domain-containing protein [Cohnella sp.]|nr:Spo0B domain-containing protein [Cohnella sp.]